MDDTPRISELRKKLEKDPGSRLFAQLAEELRKEGRHDDAISVARAGLAKNSNYPSARLTLARALLDSGRPGEARPELEQVVRAAADNILASRLLGEALEDLGELGEALRQYEHTQRLSPADQALAERIADLKARAAAAPLPAASPAVALDRDLASGADATGSVNVSDVQGHFTPDVSPASEGPAVPEFEETLPFGETNRSPDPSETADKVTLPGSPFPDLETPPEAAELASTDSSSGDPDESAKRLPLSSVTLANLYLQQGLKAEASAVLSRVMKEEPGNTRARSRLAVVSGALARTPAASIPSPEPTSPRDFAAASSMAAIPAERPPAQSPPRTGAQVRQDTIASLKAFLSAVEREAVQQRATEQRSFR